MLTILRAVLASGVLALGFMMQPSGAGDAVIGTESRPTNATLEPLAWIPPFWHIHWEPA